MTFYSDIIIYFNIQVARLHPYCYTSAFVSYLLVFSELKLHLYHVYTKHESHTQAFYSRYFYLDVEQKFVGLLYKVSYLFMSLHEYRLYNLIILINLVHLVIGSYMYILQLFLELLFSNSIMFYS